MRIEKVRVEGYRLLEDIEIVLCTRQKKITH